jgi:hypothetical protein
MLESFLPVDPFADRPPLGWSPQPEQQQFAKADPDEDEDDDDDDDDDEDDDEDDDDPDADKTIEELQAEVKAMRGALAKANGQSAKSRQRRKALQAELEQTRVELTKRAAGGSSSSQDSDDKPDVEALVAAEREKIQREADQDTIRTRAETALVGLGVSATNAELLVGKIDLDDLDYDRKTRTVDGLDEELDRLKTRYPDMFKRPARRTSTRAGGNDDRNDSDTRRPKPKTATEKQAAQLLGR